MHCGLQQHAQPSSDWLVTKFEDAFPLLHLSLAVKLFRKSNIIFTAACQGGPHHLICDSLGLHENDKRPAKVISEPGFSYQSAIATKAGTDLLHVAVLC